MPKKCIIIATFALLSTHFSCLIRYNYRILLDKKFATIPFLALELH